MVYSGTREYPEERQARIAIIPWILLSLGWALLAGALLLLALTGRKVPSEPLTKIVTEKVKVNVPGATTVTVIGENGAIGNLPGTGSTRPNAATSGSAKGSTAGRAGARGAGGGAGFVDDKCPCNCKSGTGLSVTVPGVTSATVQTPPLPKAPSAPVPAPSLPTGSVPKLP
jgi:hypothetical protein